MRNLRTRRIFYHFLKSLSLLILHWSWSYSFLNHLSLFYRISIEILNFFRKNIHFGKTLKFGLWRLKFRQLFWPSIFNFFSYLLKGLNPLPWFTSRSLFNEFPFLLHGLVGLFILGLIQDFLLFFLNLTLLIEWVELTCLCIDHLTFIGIINAFIRVRQSQWIFYIWDFILFTRCLHFCRLLLNLRSRWSWR